MPNPLQQAGAQPSRTEPSKYAPIHTNRFFTGLWTNRNPLRDAATPYLYEKFYSGSRYESLIDGLNTELTYRLTLGRAPGTSVYNNQSFPAVNRFYTFRQFTGATETIKVIADTANTIYDATGPSTKNAFFTKGGGAGSAYFQSVGNYLYFGDGVEVKKWDGTTVTNAGIAAPANAPTIVPPDTLVALNYLTFWSPLSSTNRGIILDTNGNFQQVGAPGFGTLNTGTIQPTWNPNFGQITSELSPGGGAQWANRGPFAAIWAATTAYPLNKCLVDSTGNVQQVTTAGTSGSTTPSWNTTLAGTTTDGTVTWTCRGLTSQSVYKGLGYGYAYHTTSGHVGTLSPLASIGPDMLSFSVGLKGQGSAQADCDFIWIFRTSDGGSTLQFLAQVANPGASTWTYTDTNPDSALNPFLQAPISHQNDPPPSGLINLAYHLGLMWGSVANTVYYSRTPNQAIAGDSVQSFPPLNNFVFPSVVMRLWPCAFGILVFTLSDVYLIAGTNQSGNPLYSQPFIHHLGLADYDAFTVNGTIIYMMTTDNQVVSLDPSSGVSKVGFPIGNLLSAFPAASFLTYHIQGMDEALYVGDGISSWYRMTAVAAPESGLNWSPKRVIGGGCSAIASVETTPGTYTLLIGSSGSGAIMKRDLTTFQDNGTPYAAFATIGSIVLAQPHQLAELSEIVTECVAVGSHPTLAVVFGEALPYYTGSFYTLGNYVNDPPNLAISKSIYSDRFYLSQNPSVPAVCRHMQLKIQWPNENVANELLPYTLVGAYQQEY